MNIKKNNPLNMRKAAGITWQGEAAGITAPAVLTFTSLVYGYRAALLNLNTYIKKHGANTIEKIIHRWDPDQDSSTDITPAAYIRKVSDATGIAATQKISANDFDTLANIALAMTKVEHSSTPDDSVLQSAINKAKAMITGIIAIVKRHPIETAAVLLLAYYLLTD